MVYETSNEEREITVTLFRLLIDKIVEIQRVTASEHCSESDGQCDRLAKLGLTSLSEVDPLEMAMLCWSGLASQTASVALAQTHGGVWSVDELMLQRGALELPSELYLTQVECLTRMPRS